MNARNAYAVMAAVAMLLASSGRVPAQTDCRITAPKAVENNETFTLCGPTGDGLQYEWYGPGVEADNGTRCVTARVGQPGANEYLLIVLRNGVEAGRCRTVVNVGGTTGGTRSCAITGPTSIRLGETARLCSPGDDLHTYRWTGPDGFTLSAPCITVREEGTYFLMSRNKLTGATRQCTHRLTVTGTQDRALASGGTDGDDNPDEVIYDNCPRDFQFWRSVFDDRSAADRSGLTPAELRAIARAIDERSTYLNWESDVQGARQALGPARPWTRRKQVVREYVALLANVAAGAMDLTLPNGDRIGLDLDTRVDDPGATTLRDLIGATERALRTGSGSFARLNATLNQINRGIGIDSTCD